MKKKEIQVHGAFAVPFIQFKFSGHGNYDFPEVKKSVRKPDGWVVPLNTSFPNIQDDDPYISPTQRDSLRENLGVDIARALRDCGIYNPFTLDHFWYNIYHTYQGQEPHDHLSDCTAPSPFWSAIYYAKNPSPTVFMRQADTYRTQEFPGWFDSVIAQCFHSEYTPKVEEGDVILFPPYLKHMVRAHDSDEKMRLTFSTNLLLKNLQK